MGAAIRGRRIVLGVCGGIAAFKAVDLCRRLMDAGALVSPVLTRGATRFVGELTFSALASEPTRTSLWGNPEPIPHTRLGQAADLIVVAPATARLIAAYAAGLSSDLLTATLLATRAPVIVCPAMHTEMWEHPAVVENIATLRRRGVHIVGPDAGRLAGGDSGAGRLVDPARIVEAVSEVLSREPESGTAEYGKSESGKSESGVSSGDRSSLIGRGLLRGRRAVVSAGGTREPIDPVRFIGNRSSGKQGYAIAAELARRGSEVTLVSAATSSLAAPPGVQVVAVDTAAEMEKAVTAAAPEAQVVVMAAAVADFRPKVVASAKLKKSEGPPEIVLEPTTDILAALGANRLPDQVLVGFAAETVQGRDGELSGEDLRRFATEKLASKGADFVVANDVAAPGVGFAHDTNAVTIVGSLGEEIHIPLTSKEAVAVAVADVIESRLATSAGSTSDRPGGIRDGAHNQERA